MSKKMALNPRSGYVALPLDLLEIDMTPGAFRLLTELCRMANREGLCWPSLGQLSEKLSRSKAALSGYVKELRNLDLLTTETQKTANGYNYRLKFCVVFWREWRTKFSSQERKDELSIDECSVQPIERIDSKNQIHKNQTSSACFSLIEKTLKNWQELARGQQYPAFAKAPSEKLLKDSKQILGSEPSPTPKLSGDMRTVFHQFFVERNITVPTEVDGLWSEKSEALCCLPHATGLLIDTLNELWHPRWSYPPTRPFVEKLSEAMLVVHPEVPKMRLIRFYMRQYESWSKSSGPKSFEQYTTPQNEQLNQHVTA